MYLDGSNTTQEKPLAITHKDTDMAISMKKRKISPVSKMVRHENIAAYLFLLPWLIGLVVFLLIPLGMSFYAAFTRWTIIDPPPRWIGLENFRYMFTRDNYFLFSLGITLKYMLMSLPLSIILGVALALLLNQKLRGMNFFRTVFYIPAVVTGVGVSILWLSLLDPRLGAVNTLLRSLGVANPPNWLSSPTWAVPSLVLMSIWGVGGSAIIYLAGLQNIPEHLYEAAEIDGATRWNKFWKITIPLLSPTLFFMFITGLIGAFQVFQQAYILGGGTRFMAAKHMRFYVLHLYIVAFQDGKMGYGSALAWVLVIIAAVAVLFAFNAFERRVYYEEGGSGG
jgi:multiple sugar transport system permease protein